MRGHVEEKGTRYKMSCGIGGNVELTNPYHLSYGMRGDKEQGAHGLRGDVLHVRWKMGHAV